MHPSSASSCALRINLSGNRDRRRSGMHCIRSKLSSNFTSSHHITMASSDEYPIYHTLTQNQYFHFCGVCGETSRHIKGHYPASEPCGCLNCGHASQAGSDGSEHQHCFASAFGPCKQAVFTSGYRCAACGDLIQIRDNMGALNYCTQCGCR